MKTTHILALRLRSACESVRRKEYPLSDLIPLMQQAADTLEAADAAIEELREILKMKDAP